MYNPNNLEPNVRKTQVCKTALNLLLHMPDRGVSLTYVLSLQNTYKFMIGILKY